MSGKTERVEETAGSNGRFGSGSRLQNSFDSDGDLVKKAEKQATSSRKPLPEKQFKIRDSLLTQLLTQKEIVTGHNIVISLFVHFTLCGILSDWIESGSINLGVSNIMNMFGKPRTTLHLLAVLHLTPVILFYPIFKVWASLRKKVALLDYSFAVAMIGVFGWTFYYPLHSQFMVDPLPFASATAIGIETVRIVMKMYAFLRTNTPRVLKASKGIKNKNDKLGSGAEDEIRNVEEVAEFGTKSDQEKDTVLRNRKLKASESSEVAREVRSEADQELMPNFDPEVSCPSLAKFLYFLYAPTFIYRDNYPRSPKRRWSFIVAHVAHLLGSIAFYNLIQHHFGYILIQDFGPNNPKSAKQLIDILFCQYIVGFAACMLGWCGLLHTTQNIFAELLRFGDRGFYRDWWNSTSMSEYHRTWNTPVQDFLYNYVYREAREFGFGKRWRWAPALLVFLISNIFHEYISMYCLRFFFPVMGIMFAGPGTFLTFVPNRKFPKLGNIFIHWSLGLGYAFMHMFYTMEHFARANGCPPAETPLKDFFIPRFASCGAIKWN